MGYFIVVEKWENKIEIPCLNARYSGQEILNLQENDLFLEDKSLKRSIEGTKHENFYIILNNNLMN